MNVTRREFLGVATAAGSAAVLNGSLLAAEIAPAATKQAEFAVTPQSWPLFRGDSLAQGVSPSALPDKPCLLSFVVQGHDRNAGLLYLIGAVAGTGE